LSLKCQISAATTTTPKPVQFKDQDTWELLDDNDPDFGEVTLLVWARERVLTEQQWRHQQALWQQCNGTVVQPTQWHHPMTQRINFAQSATVYSSDGESQMVVCNVTDKDGKQWRMMAFAPQSQRLWEQDEIKVRECQVAMGRMEQREQRLQEHQQYRHQMKQILQEGHERLMAQRVKYEEAQISQLAEVRRQLQRTTQRKAQRKRKNCNTGSFNQQKTPKTPKRAMQRPSRLVVATRTAECSQVCHVRNCEHIRTVPPHRKVVRKKILPQPVTRYSNTQRQLPTQSTPIHRKANKKESSIPPIPHSPSSLLGSSQTR
jgi:Zn ribbon nucleic-acid-binding protein